MINNLLKNPKLYEINTRVWIRQFDKNGERAGLKDIPDETWDDLADKGMNIVWLMGIWNTCTGNNSKYCLEEDLVRSYEKALRDWRHEDVIGSPYAIDQYTVNPSLGTAGDLRVIREKLNSRGIKLFLDFVSNHFHADTSLLQSSPEIFLEVNEELYRYDPHTFFKTEVSGRIKYFAHGRDPFFPAWQDTVQVNYFSMEAIKRMTDILSGIAGLCDGVRCDMAMLALRNVFSNTWGGVLKKMGFNKPDIKFWKYAIEQIKMEHPGFIFMAEAYWDLEWDLQQLGFDYTYDKKLTDRLLSGNVPEIKAHLKAEQSYQLKSVRFIENHDEERAVTLFGKYRSMAAAVIISTLQGMRFYNDGQLEGRRTKLPVQLGRCPAEMPDKCLSVFYSNLLSIIKDEIFESGRWSLIDTLPAWEDNSTCENLLAWNWNRNHENRLIIVNYSDIHSHGRIRLDVRGFDDQITLEDLLTGEKYVRSTEEIYHEGLYVDLKAFQSHIFRF